jgi:hypothetical protein
MNDDLENLVGSEHSVIIGSLKITVREVRMKELKGFTAACAPFLREFDEAGSLANRKVDGGEVPPDEFALFKVISEHSEAMMRAAALVSNAPLEVYERMRPDEFFRVASLVIQVNGNFFVQSLAPQLIKFARAMSLVGTMLFKPSSAPDTGTRT